METWFKDAAAVSVSLLVVCQGLRTPLNSLEALRTHRALLLRSLASVVLLVPVSVYVLVLLIHPERRVSIGLALFAASPAAPMMIFRLFKLGSAQAFGATLHLGLALSSIVTVPATVYFLSHGLGFTAQISPVHVSTLVAKLVLGPVLVGIAFRIKFPALTERVVVPIERIAKVALLVVLLVLTGKTYHFVFMLDLRSYVAMAAAIILSLSIGHFMAGRASPAERTVLALESAGRHPGMVLLIVAVNAPKANALPVIVPYLCIFAVLSTLYVSLNKFVPVQSRAATAR